MKESFIVVFFCSVLNVATTLNSSIDDCELPSYFIENERTYRGSILNQTVVSELSQCVALCDRTLNCHGVNFLNSMLEEPVCLLMDPDGPVSLTDLPIDEAVMYSGTKFCLQDVEKVPDKRWTFEKFDGRDLIDQKYAIDTVERTDLSECLSACFNHDKCHAALYAEKTRRCRLSAITLQNVQVSSHYFRFVDDTDLYEVNGVKRSVDRSRCTFMRLNQAGVTDVYDAKIGVVNDVATCERLCTLWSSGFCRSFTFDKEKKLCYLSHATSRFLGRDPFMLGNKNISMGDLDDCVHYRLQCRADDMVVKGSAIKLFNGKVQMKKGSQVLCQNQIEGSFDFETKIPYGECGLEKRMDPDLMFSGTIMVKEGSTELITIKDKVIQVNCRMHQDVELIAHRSLSFHLEVNNENATMGAAGHDDPSNPYIISKVKSAPLPPKGPKYRLEVFRATGQLADFVNAGDNGYLLVTVNKNEHDAAGDFLVSNLVAKDKSTGEQFRLLDGDGCVINGTVTSFERLNQHQLKISMTFEGFDDQAEVIYQAIVKPCMKGCQLACTEDLYIRNNYTGEGRRRRSIVSISNSRYFDLSEDVYAVKSRERVTIMSKDEEVTKEEVSARSVSECLTDDVSCLFAVMLAFSQVFLFVSCASIVYFYVQQWRHTAALRRRVESASSDVQYEYRVKHDSPSSSPRPSEQIDRNN